MRKLLFLLVGLFTFLSSSAWTLYYADTKDTKWDQVAVYGWTGNTKQFGAWPGTLMTYVEEFNGVRIYKLETSVDVPETIIFNNNDKGGQEREISKPEDGYVYTVAAEKTYTSLEDFKTNYEAVSDDVPEWALGADNFNGDNIWSSRRNLREHAAEWDAINNTWTFECTSLNGFKFVLNGNEYWGVDSSNTLMLNAEDDYTVSATLKNNANGNTQLEVPANVVKLTVTFNVLSKQVTIKGEVGKVDYSGYKVELKSSAYQDDQNKWLAQTFTGANEDGILVVKGFKIGSGSGFNLSIYVGEEEQGYTMSEITVGQAVTLSVGSNWNSNEGVLKNKTFDFTFDFANMTLTLTEAHEEVELQPGEAYVYFVNQKDWTAVNVYAYTNGVGENAKFPGVPMTKVVAADPVYSLIKEGDRDKLYKAVVNVNNYEQVIFAQAGDIQTRNLDLIASGVYYPDEELFPSAWVDAENNELLAFPNDKVPSRFNTIYIDDATLYEYASTEGKVVTIDIKGAIEETGEKTLKPTGNDGTTALVPVEIAGKKYLRLRLPQRLFPDGCWMQLRVYEGKNASEGNVHCSASNHEDDQYHWTCDDPHRIIYMPNVQFHNGYIYSRKSNTDGISILTKATPKAVKIKAASEGALKINGEAVAEYTLTENIDGVYLTYTVENVDKDSKFNVVAVFETSLRDEERNYAAAGGDAALFPGNAQKMEYEAEGAFTISPIAGTDNYDLQVVWFNSEIIATGAKTTPNFKPAGEGNHFRIVGVSDVNEAGVNLTLGHHEAFGGSNENHYSAVEVTMEPTKAYADIFHGKNQKAQVGRLQSNGNGSSTVNVKAYTAGIYNLSVRLTEDINDGAQKFRASTTVIPVRVAPSIESVGLSFNFVRYQENNGELCINLAFGDNGDQEFPTFTDDINREWNSEKVYLSTNYAEHNTVRIYWKEIGGADNEVIEDVTDGPLFVAAAKSALDVNTDENAAEVANGYKLAKNMNSAPNLKQLAEEKKSLSFIVEQNGIYSAPQTVKVYNSATDAPTGVEAVEAAGEAEAVYYDLNGVRVSADSLAPGIYVVVKGEKTEKIIVR